MEFFDDLFEKNNPERPNLFERCKMSDENNPNAFHFWFEGMNKTLISKEFKISESVNPRYARESYERWPAYERGRKEYQRLFS